MKKQNTSRFWSCLVASLVVSPVFAQSNKQVLPASFTSPARQTVVAAPSSPAMASARAGEKVEQAFERSFKGVAAPFWYAYANKYVAEFKMGDRLALACFGKRGHLIYKVLYGTARHLPDFEKELVQSLYPDYEITATQEITAGSTKLWVVLVQNCTGMIRIRVMDGEVDEIERIKKAK